MGHVPPLVLVGALGHVPLCFWWGHWAMSPLVLVGHWAMSPFVFGGGIGPCPPLFLVGALGHVPLFWVGHWAMSPFGFGGGIGPCSPLVLVGALEHTPPFGFGGGMGHVPPLVLVGAWAMSPLWFWWEHWAMSPFGFGGGIGPCPPFLVGALGHVPPLFLVGALGHVLHLWLWGYECSVNNLLCHYMANQTPLTRHNRYRESSRARDRYCRVLTNLSDANLQGRSSSPAHSRFAHDH